MTSPADAAPAEAAPAAPRAASAVGWQVLRLAAAALILAAVVAQAATTFGQAAAAGRDMATTVANFFSFFTVLSNILSIVVLAWAASWRLRAGQAGRPDTAPLALALASVTTYMIVTGVVYNILLRGIALPQGTTVPWSNEVLHVVGPAFLLADLVFAPGRRRLAWRAVWGVLVFPVLWVAYTLVRGPLVVNQVTGAHWWYPYPFLDPHSFENGYGTVALYVVGIGAAIALFATLVVWVGRVRGARDD